jgi:hypothetical protein
MKNQTVPNINIMERTTCHHGGSNASLAGMMIGENNGNSDAKMARFPFGLDKTGNNI